MLSYRVYVQKKSNFAAILSAIILPVDDMCGRKIRIIERRVPKVPSGVAVKDYIHNKYCSAYQSIEVDGYGLLPVAGKAKYKLVYWYGEHSHKVLMPAIATQKDGLYQALNAYSIRQGYTIVT